MPAPEIALPSNSTARASLRASIGQNGHVERFAGAIAQYDIPLSVGARLEGNGATIGAENRVAHLGIHVAGQVAELASVAIVEIDIRRALADAREGDIATVGRDRRMGGDRIESVETGQIDERARFGIVQVNILAAVAIGREHDVATGNAGREFGCGAVRAASARIGGKLDRAGISGATAEGASGEKGEEEKRRSHRRSLTRKTSQC